MSTTLSEGKTEAKPPSQKQLEFAQSLGIESPSELSRFELSRKIKAEIRKRGRAVLKDRQPERYDLVLHPTHGLCEIDRIGTDTLKITLLIVHENRKIVVDAMRLGDCPPA